MNFDQMMAELRAEYLASIPEKIRNIETHIKERDFTQLRDDFHKLKGTGKTYGIPEISELCEVVEKICLAKGDAALTAALKGSQILAQIQTARMASKTFPIGELNDFLQIKKLI